MAAVPLALVGAKHGRPARSFHPRSATPRPRRLPPCRLRPCRPPPHPPHPPYPPYPAFARRRGSGPRALRHPLAAAEIPEGPHPLETGRPEHAPHRLPLVRPVLDEDPSAPPEAPARSPRDRPDRGEPVAPPDEGPARLAADPVPPEVRIVRPKVRRVARDDGERAGFERAAPGPEAKLDPPRREAPHVAARDPRAPPDRSRSRRPPPAPPPSRPRWRRLRTPYRGPQPAGDPPPPISPTAASTASTSRSVSGRGTRVERSTSRSSDQNSRRPVSHASGSPAARCPTSAPNRLRSAGPTGISGWARSAVRGSASTCASSREASSPGESRGGASTAASTRRASSRTPPAVSRANANAGTGTGTGACTGDGITLRAPWRRAGRPGTRRAADR